MRYISIAAILLIFASLSIATEKDDIDLDLELELQLAFRPLHPETTQAPTKDERDKRPTIFPQAVVLSIIGSLIAGSFVGGASCWYMRRKRTSRQDAGNGINHA